MKLLYKISAGLIAISIGLSLYLFLFPVNVEFVPHWIGPLIAIVSFVIILSAERGPKPKNPERGFWTILIGTPILGILLQLHHLAHAYEALAFFGSELVPILGYHVFLAIVGNYVTTSKSMMSGIPTPWNLRSDMSWRKSHRLMGFAFVAIAIISALAILVTGEFQKEVLATGMMSLLPIFAVYSWWVWKNDPDKRPLMGTS